MAKTSMSASILEVIQRLKGVKTEKKEIIHSAEFIHQVVIKHHLIPMFTALLRCRDPKYKNTEKEIRAIKEHNLLKLLVPHISIDAKDGYDILKELETGILLIEKHMPKYISTIEKKMSDKIDSENLKVFTGAALKFIMDVHTICAYILDVLQAVVCNEKELPKNLYKSVHENIREFGSLWRVYGYSFDKKVDELANIADSGITISSNSTAHVTDVAIREEKQYIDLPAVSGFIGNPFYHVRMMLADQDAERLNLMKAEKARLEFKLLELRQKQEQGNTDPNVATAIEKINVDINALRKDIERRLDI